MPGLAADMRRLPAGHGTPHNIEVAVHFEYSVVLIYLTVSAVIVGMALWVGRFLRPNLPDAQKSQIYECGERPIGTAWFNFNPRFYLIALVFIVFDAEIALTFPVAVVVREWVSRQDGSGWVAVTEIILFFVILIAALAYVWGKGELDWSRELTEPGEMP
jgi:NADH-quinone oxidoreductase subunit A